MKTTIKKTKSTAPPTRTRAVPASLWQTPKGMPDILPGEQVYRDRLRLTGRALALYYGFGRIETPVLEFADLFIRGIGEETDLVGKEMYVFKTKGGDRVALRPEGTAPVLRAYFAHGLGSQAQPQKLFYEAAIFRHERPQAGRFREHTQTGFEIIGGPSDPLYDAQMIVLIWNFLRDLKLPDIQLKLNSIGCRVCRPSYRRELQGYYKRHESELCADCNRRLQINPLRLLDCKNESCEPLKAKAPSLLDKLCVLCSRHFRAVLEYLTELNVPYELDARLVRGLDYYSRTVFEFFVGQVDVGAIASGGRYDYLAEALGARLTPGVGGAVGWERVIAALKTRAVKIPEKNLKKVFLVHVGELAKRKALQLIEKLRGSPFIVGEALGKESLQAQLKLADRDKAALALILGQKEIYEETIIIRDLRSGLQETVRLDKIEEEMKKRWRLYTEERGL